MIGPTNSLVTQPDQKQIVHSRIFKSQSCVKLGLLSYLLEDASF